MSDDDIERIADRVVAKLEERRTVTFTSRIHVQPGKKKDGTDMTMEELATSVRRELLRHSARNPGGCNGLT